MAKFDPARQLQTGLRILVKLVDWLVVTIVTAPLLAVLLVLLLFGVVLPLLLYHSLAILASAVLVLLFVYVHNTVERRYFSKAFLRAARGSRPSHWLVLANRLLMLCLFLFFESLLLAHWGLYDPKSPGVFIHFWLVHLFILIWAFDPPAELSEAFSRQSRAAGTAAPGGGCRPGYFYRRSRHPPGR